MEKKIKAESLVEATIRVSNADEADRKYDITASAKVQNGTVTSVTEGSLKPVQTDGADPYGQTVTFNAWEGSRMHVEFPQDMADKAGALEAVESFITDCKASAESLV